MELEFTQYLRPGGRKKAVSTEIRDELAGKVKQIKELGLVFEIEVLRNGMVSATITHPLYADLAFSITPNGPQVQQGIEKMIEDFDLKEQEAIIARYMQDDEEDVAAMRDAS